MTQAKTGTVRRNEHVNITSARILLMTKLGDCKFKVSLMLKTRFINQEVVLRIVSRDKEEIESKRGKQFSPKFPLNTMTAIN